LVSRGADAPCPACGEDNWTALQQPDIDLAIPGEDSQSRKVIGLPVVVIACLKCGFVRLHARDIITNEPYLSPPPEPEETA